MKYSDETIGAIADAIAGMPFNSSAHETIAVMLRALESTDEQKALRADAERWRKWIIAAKAPTGYEP